ncbi:hypothetical protein PPACK8108_LOCUS11170 [Phakopsora pachyrhizi]|uniref:Secreted protein n=1 Tax=Phakopsora pachyrhizi TaxID=170000 RepID=A0AAV0B1C2_PHAPC|nr:hypothetical protein PPACK8108_LOCUS11170 [Phakopsora pachyrhizi]
MVAGLLSLQEPPQVDAEPILRAGCESSFPRDFAADSEAPAEDRIEYEWPEGSKLVTENEIGEVVRVEPNSCRRLRNMQSLPTLPLSAIVHSPKPPQENNFSLPDLNKPATFQGLDITWNEEEWEEDERFINTLGSHLFSSIDYSSTYPTSNPILISVLYNPSPSSMVTNGLGPKEPEMFPSRVRQVRLKISLETSVDGDQISSSINGQPRDPANQFSNVAERSNLVSWTPVTFEHSPRNTLFD